METPAPASDPSRKETPPEAPSRRRTVLRAVHRVLRFVRFAVLFFVLSTILAVLVYRVVPPPVTPLMLLRLPEQARAGIPLKLYKEWTPLARMSPWLPAAAVAAEDQRFYSHHGFDFRAIEAARRHNEKARGRPMRGASTISQQTAKNVFLWPARSWTRKGLEVWFTFLIELLWPKERILEVYLNVAEFGPGVYGVQAAARHHFGRDAARLTRAQAAMLAAILPRPLVWSPRHPARPVLRQQARILRQMPAFLRRDD